MLGCGLVPLLHRHPRTAAVEGTNKRTSVGGTNRVVVPSRREEFSIPFKRSLAHTSLSISRSLPASRTTTRGSWQPTRWWHWRSSLTSRLPREPRTLAVVCLSLPHQPRSA